MRSTFCAHKVVWQASSSVMVWPFPLSSGELNFRSAEHFDHLEVAVKQGEIDWLHIAPETHCRVATKRQVWWSLESGLKQLWDYEPVKRLCATDDVHCIHAAASRIWTNVAGCKCVDDFERLPCKFQQFLNRPEADHKPGELIITMDEVTGTGEQQSLRMIGEEENEGCIGGLRNAARSVVKVRLIGSRTPLITKEIVDANQAVLSEVLDHLGNKETSRVGQGRCVVSYEKLSSVLGLGHEVLATGLFPGLFEGHTLAMQDPDVHVHEWLRGVPFPLASLPAFYLEECFQRSHHSVWTEKQQAPEHLNAKVWDAHNCSNHHEHKEKADKVL